MQHEIQSLLSTLPDTLFTNRDKFLDALKAAEKTTGTKLDVAMRKAVLSTLSERDENADVCTDSKGNPESDPELRDTENVPPRPLDEIEADLKAVENEILELLKQVTE